MTARPMKLTLERLSEVCAFHAETGTFYWKRKPETTQQAASWNARCAGRKVGSFINTGYLQTTIDGEKLVLHRMVWLYVHGRAPEEQIDHINGVRSDNRPENLRLSPQIQNAKNQALRSTNTSGVTGVAWLPRRRKWMAQICVGGKVASLGVFASKDAAIACRRQAERHHGFDPNHGLPASVRAEISLPGAS